MTNTTDTAPPPATRTALNDLWYDTGNGNLRSQCVGVMTWQPAGGLTGWTAAHASLIASPQSPYLLLATADGTGVSGWSVTSPPIPAAAGDTACASCPVMVPSPFDVPVNLAAVYVGVAWLNSSGGVISVTQSTAAVVDEGATATLTVTATGAPAGTVSACVVVGDAEDSAAGTQIFAGPAALAVWSAFPSGTNAIASAAITPPLIAAGAITAGAISAGAIDGMTITGAEIIAHGSSGEILVYSGTPAAGNLIMSVSGANGTDTHGNLYLPGICTYLPGTGYQAIQMQGSSMLLLTASTYAGPYTEEVGISLTSGNGVQVAAGVSSLILTPDEPTVLNTPLTLKTVTAVPATPSGGCVLYYKSGALWALGPSGTPVSLATT